MNPGTNGLESRALLISLNTSCWSASIIDKTITKEVADKHGLQGSAGRYIKELFPHKPLKAVQSAFGALRNDYYQNTLPWDDRSWRLIPSTVYLDLHSRLNEQIASILGLVGEFVDQYDSHCLQAERSLNGIHRPSDYPSKADVRAKFGAEVNTRPLPVFSSDIRQSIGDEAYQEITRSAQEQIAEQYAGAQRDLWDRLSKVVGNAAEALAVPDKIFRDSLIGNIKETCAIARSLNLAQNADIDSMASDIMRTLGHLDPQDLRDDPAHRAHMASQADAIMQKMAAYI